jgi:hypothetical protein
MLMGIAPLPVWSRNTAEIARRQRSSSLSVWLRGENMIASKAAVVDTRYKDGRIILIGIRCQNRAQSHGTYKFLLNELLYPDKE